MVLLLLSPLLAGCLGGDDGPRLAQPTDKPLVLPGDQPQRPTGARYDLNDPGYVVNGTWQVGDGWDYESNRSNYRHVRVVEAVPAGIGTLYRVEERSGKIGQAASATRVSWVDSRGWLLLNATSDAGALDAYKPGVPQRLWRNTTVTFNHTRVDAAGKATNDSAQLVARLLPDHQTLLFPWGYVEAKRVEQRVTTRANGNVTGVSTSVHWVHRDYLGDVQYDVDGAETFKLVAAQVGGMRRGTLASR